MNLGEYILWSLTLAMAFPGAWLARKAFPSFAAYLYFCALRTVTLMGCGYGTTAYFWAYWIGIILGGFFMVLVISELYGHALKPYWTIPNAVMASVLFALALSITLLIQSPLPPLYANLKEAESALYMVNAASLIVLGVACVWLRIPWRNHAAAITGGFLFFLAIQALIAAVSPYAANRELLRAAHMASFAIAQLWWIRNLARKEPARIETQEHELVFARETLKKAAKAQGLAIQRIKERIA